jgi:hypothetical protein
VFSLVFQVAQAASLKPELPLHGVSLNLGNALLLNGATQLIQNLIIRDLPPDATVNRGLYLPLELIYHRTLSPSFDATLGLFYRYSSLIFLKGSSYLDLNGGGEWFLNGTRSGFSLASRLGLAFWQAYPTPFGNTTMGMRYDFLQWLVTGHLSAAFTLPVQESLRLRFGAGVVGGVPMGGTSFKFGYFFESFNALYYIVPDLEVGLWIPF